MRALPYLLLLLAPQLSGCPGPNPLFADARGDYQLAPDVEICLSNNDGVITASELAFIPGISVRYRVNPPGTLVTLDAEGSLDNSTRTWDFSSLAGEVFEVGLQPPTGHWFSEHFPEASFVVPADLQGETLQVFVLEPDALQLLGIASRAPEQTLLRYTQAVTLLRFPLQLGDTFTSQGSVSDGKLAGLPVALEDTYVVAIDARGTVRLPYLRLTNSLRISVKVTSRALGGAVAERQQYQWFHECYGELARASGAAQDSPASFSASELRRLTF